MISLYLHDPFPALQRMLVAPWLDVPMALLSMALEGWAIALIGAAFVLTRERAGRGSARTLATLGVALLLAGAGAQLLKAIVPAPRPLSVLGPGAVHVLLEPLRHRSFPSGHAASAGALAMFALLRYRLRAWPLAVLAILGGLSRVYVGAHWALDVVAGWTLGALAALAATPVLAAATALGRPLLSGAWARRPSPRGDGAGGVKAVGRPELVGLQPESEPLHRNARQVVDPVEPRRNRGGHGGPWVRDEHRGRAGVTGVEPVVELGAVLGDHRDVR